MTAADYDDIWRDVYGDMQDVGPVHRHMRRLLARLLRDLEYRTVMDVGCGSGHNLPLVCDGRALDRVLGADVSEEALRRARRRAPAVAEFARLDIESSALNEAFDLVFCALVLEHLVDDEAALANLRAVTGRHLVVATIAGDYERYRAFDERVGHVRNYQPGELEAKLERAGFAVRRATYWGFPLYSPLVRTLQNRSVPRASYGRMARIAASVLYPLFFLNSSRRGDLLIVHATAVTDSRSG